MKDEDSFINPKFTLRKASKQMSLLGKKCLIVVKKNKFLGTLSDGDIRKALLSTGEINTPIQNIFNGFKRELALTGGLKK